MTTSKIAIKPQSEYTADELRALDEWAAFFVGFRVMTPLNGMTGYYGRNKEKELQLMAYKYANFANEQLMLWRPSSTDAPLWQLSIVLEKAHSTDSGKKYWHSDIKSNLYDAAMCEIVEITSLDWGLYTLQNPATVLAAIMQTIGEE